MCSKDYQDQWWSIFSKNCQFSFFSFFFCNTSRAVIVILNEIWLSVRWPFPTLYNKFSIIWHFLFFVIVRISKLAFLFERFSVTVFLLPKFIIRVFSHTIIQSYASKTFSYTKCTHFQNDRFLFKIWICHPYPFTQNHIALNFLQLVPVSRTTFSYQTYLLNLILT